MSTLAAAVVAALPEHEVSSDAGFGPVTVDVRREQWVAGLEAARAAGAEFFDLLTAYDLGEEGFAVVAHLASADLADHLLLRTSVPRDEPALASATGVYRGASWHERETHEMFGIVFVGLERPDPLLLPPGLGLAPLRKEVVLAARAVRPWPGERDPADSAGRARRRITPPGVPADWPAPPEAPR